MRAQRQPLELRPKLTLWLVGFSLAILFSVLFSRRPLSPNVIGFTVLFLIILFSLRFKTRLIVTDQFIISERLLQKTEIPLGQITKIDVSWKTYGKDFRNVNSFTRSQVMIVAPNQKINISTLIYSEEQIILILKSLHQILKEKYPNKTTAFSASAQKAVSNRYPII